MPKVDGIEVCRRLRNKTNIPILMLTAKDQEVDKVLGLGIGADDYITKPFSINEVIARVKSLMRRFLILGSDGESLEKTSIQYKDLTIDLKKYISVIGGEEVPLTAKEFELLKFLAAHNEQVFTKRQLYRNVWDSDYIEDDNTVMLHMRKIRKIIDVDPSNLHFIEIVCGIGYKFVSEQDE